jgi:hypothetical protein
VTSGKQLSVASFEFSAMEETKSKTFVNIRELPGERRFELSCCECSTIETHALPMGGDLFFKLAANFDEEHERRHQQNFETAEALSNAR